MVEHVDHCEKCQNTLETAAAGRQLWSDLRKTLDTCDLRESMVDVNQVTLERITEYLGPTDHPEMLGRLGSYEICGLVGQGSTGVVAKAFEPSLNRYVAIKLLSPVIAASGPARNRFAREARAAAAVLHENVIPIYAVDQHQGLPYIVTQYVAGGSLQNRIDKRGPLDTREVVRIATQVSRGLAAAHAQGIVHRDVKPANIMLESSVDRAVVSDFGLARVADDAAATRSGVIAGTPQYMSPEQARGERIDHRSDLFSLGTVMYVACTARLPFRGETVFGVIQRVCEYDPLPIRETNPDVPRWLEAFIEKLLAKRRDDRFESAEQVAEHLARELAHLQSAEPIAEPQRPWMVDRKSEPKKHRVARTVALSLIALATLGLASFFVTPPSPQTGDADSAEQPPVRDTAPVPEVTRQIGRIEEFAIDEKQTFPAVAAEILVFEMDRGGIEVRAAEGEELTIHVKRVVKAATQEEAEEVARRHAVSYTPSGETLHVRAQLDPELRNESSFQSIQAKLFLPTGYHVDLSTTGKIVLDGVHVSDAKLSTSGGPIRATDVTGDIVAHSAGGDINLENIRGAIESLASAGTVRASIAAPPRDDILLQSTQGNVEVLLAEDFPLKIDARSQGGRISSSFVSIADDRHHVTWQLLGGGGPRITARTNGGHISFGYMPDRQSVPAAFALPISGITLDGDLTDWPDGMPQYKLAARSADRVADGDAEACFRLGYDSGESALYVAVDVTDQEVVVNGRHGDHWNAQDSCEVFVDAQRTPWKRQPSQFFVRRQPGAYPWDRRGAAKVVRRVQPTRIIYEWRIDLGQLRGGDMLDVGETIGFDVVICDRDDDQSMKMLAWGPHSDEKWHNSLKLSNLQLVERLPAGP